MKSDQCSGYWNEKFQLSILTDKKNNLPSYPIPRRHGITSEPNTALYVVFRTVTHIDVTSDETPFHCKEPVKRPSISIEKEQTHQYPARWLGSPPEQLSSTSHTFHKHFFTPKTNSHVYPRLHPFAHIQQIRYYPAGSPNVELELSRASGCPRKMTCPSTFSLATVWSGDRLPCLLGSIMCYQCIQLPLKGNGMIMWFKGFNNVNFWWC